MMKTPLVTTMIIFLMFISLMSTPLPPTAR